MDHRLVYAVVLTEYRRFLGEPTFYIVSLLRPYLWTLLLSEGIRHSTASNHELSLLGLLSYCIVFTGITSSFSLCWERHHGFLRLWFVYGLNNLDYIVGKLIFSCSLTCLIILMSLPLCFVINVPLDAIFLIEALPDICLAIILIASIGLLVASIVTRMDLFGIVINFILFPILFTSGAIYEITSTSLFYYISLINPFRWAIEPLKILFSGTAVDNSEFILSRIAIVIFCGFCLFFSLKFLKKDC